MHLLTSYAHAARLRIDKPITNSQFFALPFEDKYIVVVSGTGMEAKNYPYWSLVIDFLRPILSAAGYKIIQTGGEKDERLNVDLDLCGKTNISQYQWIIEKSSMVLCGDTSAIHIASCFDVPFVSLFSLSRPEISGAHFGDPTKQVYITPENWNPSFFPGENPRQIANIKPEAVVEGVCNLLNLQFKKFKSLHFGGKFNQGILDIVPNCVAPNNFLQGALMNIRLDKGGQEDICYEQVKHRQCVIVTDKILNKDTIRALKPNIVKIFYVLNDVSSIDFIKFLKSEGIPFETISSLDEEKTNLLKLDFADYCIIYPNEIFFGEFKGRIEFSKIDNVKCRTRRRILSEGKFYLSYLNEYEKNASPSFDNSEIQAIDSPNFWAESDYFYIYEFLE